MSLGTILLIILIVLLIGGVPNLGLHQHGWGPSGAIGVILIIVLILLLLGKL